MRCPLCAPVVIPQADLSGGRQNSGGGRGGGWTAALLGLVVDANGSRSSLLGLVIALRTGGDLAPADVRAAKARPQDAARLDKSIVIAGANSAHAALGVAAGKSEGTGKVRNLRVQASRKFSGMAEQVFSSRRPSSGFSERSSAPSLPLRPRLLLGRGALASTKAGRAPEGKRLLGNANRLRGAGKKCSLYWQD